MAGVGDSFPAHRLAALEGGERDLAAAWDHGPALIVVGHSTCDTTRYTLPHLARLQRERRSGTEVLAVLQDDADAARAVLKRVGAEDLIVALERPPWPLASALGLTAVPTLYLVAPGGRIEAMSEGFVRDDVERFARALDAPEPFFAPDVKVAARRPG